MTLEKSQKIVKILGILNIIAAVLSLVSALGMFGIGGLGVATEEIASDASMQEGLVSVFAAGIVLLFSSIVSFVEGIFSLRAAKDAKKAQPLWVISLVAVIFSVLSLVTSFGDASKLAGEAIGLLINCGIFYLANNIKKNA